MKQKNITPKLKLVIWTFFAVFTVWWLYINLILRSPDHGSLNNQTFAALYGIMAVIGGVAGLIAASKWGGRKSLIGRALLFFSIGLLAQEFGQLSYSYYAYVLSDKIPYPSVGDIGYFASVLFYIYAALLLAKAAGVTVSLKDHSRKIVAIVLPLILLITSYIFFLRGYQFELKSALTVFLDFGYPFGQAIYIGIALVTYLLSKGLLGGIMRNKVLLLLFALCIQYVADFSFLYAAKAEKVFPAGANDYLYLLAYTTMALALTMFCIPLLAKTKEPIENESSQEKNTVVE